MRFQAAVIKEQNVTFGLVVVKKHVIDNISEARENSHMAHRLFPGIPVVLTAQDSQGRAHYYGRADIVRFMKHVPLSAIPWKEYTLA